MSDSWGRSPGKTGAGLLFWSGRALGEESGHEGNPGDKLNICPLGVCVVFLNTTKQNISSSGLPISGSGKIQGDQRETSFPLSQSGALTVLC